LVIIALDIRLPVTVLGITPQSSRNIREILLILSATLALYQISVGRDSRKLAELMRAVIQKMAKDDYVAEIMLRMRYGVSTLWKNLDTTAGELRPGPVQWIAMTVQLSGAVLIIVGIITGAAVLHIFILLDIYQHPSFSPFFAKLTIAYVITCDVVTTISSLLER